MSFKKLGVFIPLLLMIAGLLGCAGASKEPGRYRSRLEKFSIQLPVGWQSIDPALGALVSVVNPERTVTINVSADKVDSGYTDKQALQHLNARGQDSNIFYSETGDALMAGIPGHWLKGISGNQNFISLLYFVIHSSRLYSIQFITRADQFDNYQFQFDSIIQSFKFE
jgi:hypothetical protein